MPDSMPRGSFLWGAASAAFQVEGHPRAEGRGLSKWDLYTHRDRITEAVVGTQYDADTAIDAYDRDRYLADIALMKKAGLDAYRFSISWTRILPAGTGHVNQAGVDHYSRFVDDLLDAGITPLVTLYHWDFPEVLQERGGWHAPDSVGWFRDYAAEVFRAIGDRVDAFVTINEPMIDLLLMDLVAENVRAGAAPFAFTDEQFARQADAMHHLLSASAAAIGVFRDMARTGRVGVALSLHPTLPVDAESPDDVAAAAGLDDFFNRWQLDAVLRGTYPDSVVAMIRRHNPAFAPSEADMAAMAENTVDFVGINYYSPAIVKADPTAPLGGRWGAKTNPDPVPAFNGPVRPDQLHRLLMRIRDDYDNPPMVITENGAGFGDIDEIGDGDAVHDPLRTDYVRRHVEAVLQARADGADVRGYMCWSLFDNFEWIQGYERRFGLVWVDFDTQQRIPKDSFHAYRTLIRESRKGS